MPAGIHDKFRSGDAPSGPGPFKRKRDLDDNGIPDLTRPDRIPQPRPPQSGNTTPINYLSVSGIKTSSLSLLRGDNGVFNEVISLINDYEGVLGRNESLAANLGAKLTAPRLLGAMESLFEGEIKVYPKDPSGVDQPCKPSWLDILEFAASNPDEFNLTTLNGVGRVCRFSMKNVHVQISWDDWQLIRSGTLDRFSLVPPKPLEEDERIELTTLDLVEDRVHRIIQKADEIAAKARQLNYHLSGCKAAIAARYTFQHTSELNQPSARHRELKPDPDLRAYLLQQFLSQAAKQASRQVETSIIGISGSSPSLASFNHSQSHIPPAVTLQSLDLLMPTLPGTLTPLQQRTSPSHMENTVPQDPARRLSGESSSALERNRSIIGAAEKPERGALVNPRCDNCQRHAVSCVPYKGGSCKMCFDR
ncbi:hypothetical protein QBC32DRAFT_40772 [Pseudoneurospora amorphoporcata]|uniref:Zn(2)-C6 fungal-type domain-containing protein n=1 Tax=Pseudoneurospora amorphoporcata TaxID=241081 RepID=A0AAN6SD53_9PEZI|nr:hypothetical protein QBC32DRAFT_40772 [Pseudoneurospora amorphoporcata]